MNSDRGSADAGRPTGQPPTITTLQPPPIHPGECSRSTTSPERAGVSIASVSRVLNGHANPRPDTQERVLRAVAELGFVPDGAARALSGRLKEVVAVVFRRAAPSPREASSPTRTRACSSST